MFIADLHCDTLSALYTKERQGEAVSLMKNDLRLDIQKMNKGKYLLQNFAVYVDWGEEENPYACAKEQIRLFMEQMKRHGDSIRQARTFREMEENRKAGRITAVLTLEEGEICQGSQEKLKELYDAGARMMTLTWNYENSYGSPAVLDERRICAREHKGLTETGISFLESMEQLGMIVDVSHLSDEGIADVLKITKKPIAASHSNARSLCPHPRNLTDGQICSIAERGGIIGVNYYGKFLADKQENGIYFSKIDDIVRHISYIADLGGISCVGLGSDFDGTNDNPDLKDASYMEVLACALKKQGFKSSEIEAVCFKNVWNFYKEML